MVIKQSPDNHRMDICSSLFALAALHVYLLIYAKIYIFRLSCLGITYNCGFCEYKGVKLIMAEILQTIPEKQLKKILNRVKFSLILGILTGYARYSEDFKHLRKTKIPQFYLEFRADPDRFPNVKLLVFS
jgi:hypothetical protein